MRHIIKGAEKIKTNAPITIAVSLQDNDSNSWTGLIIGSIKISLSSGNICVYVKNSSINGFNFFQKNGVWFQPSSSNSCLNTSS